jgi:pimeloyl-ACP methyl ester carboxylesterase
MPDVNGVRVHHRFDGSADAPVLVLCNSLGTTLEMWDPQMPAFAQRFRVLRYDTRGHGRSAVPRGPTPLRTWARTCSRSSTRTASSGCASAASPWAA